MSKGMVGRGRTKVYLGHLLGKYSTEHDRNNSVRPQCPTEESGKVRYELHTGTRHFGKFGTTSIPVPDTSVSSVRHQ